jgi:hypothetical protein
MNASLEGLREVDCMIFLGFILGELFNKEGELLAIRLGHNLVVDTGKIMPSIEIKAQEQWPII